MSYQLIPIVDLLVNRDNDRHGHLDDEDAALKWLLENRSDHMRRLAADIVETRTIFEPPLVRLEDADYVVYDGNRRVASLKLLMEPGRAPTPEWTRFYAALGEMAAELPSEIECRIEDDGDLIDELLYRRHTGAQGGVGQSAWDPDAKHNFIERTGRGRQINIAREVMAALHKYGYSRSTADIPLSNLNRLLSGEAQRNRIGLRLKKEILSFTHDPAAVLRALTRIAEDLFSREVTLQEIWDAESKDRYLQHLDADSVLPNVKFALRNPIPVSDWAIGEDEEESSDSEENPGESGTDWPGIETEEQPDKPKPDRRASLIPSDVNYGLPKTPELTRIRAVWNELQFRLKLSKQPNAISVLFRVLLEFSADHYLNAVGETQDAGKGWRDKMKVAVQYQLNGGLIDEQYAAILNRFQRQEELLSAASMNKYIHSADLSPSSQHMCSVWDTLQRFIVNCVRA